MITANDLFFLIDRAAPGTTKAERARLQNIRSEAERMRAAEEAEKCWLKRCNRPVSVRLVSGGYQLHLCSEHGTELEEKADEAGSYSNATPAKGYRSHWPWKRPTT